MSSAKWWRFSAACNVLQLVMDEPARTQLALATLTTDVPRPPIAIIECGHMVECLVFFLKFSQQTQHRLPIRVRYGLSIAN